MKYAVPAGRTRLRAHVHFGLIDPKQLVSDDYIASILVKEGLQDVKVVGEGRERWAFGTYDGPAKEVDLPGVVIDVEKL